MLHRAPALLFALLAALPLSAAPPQPFAVSPPGTCADHDVEIAPRPGGGFVAAWIARAEPEGPPQVHARLFHADGSPEGDAFPVDPEEEAAAEAVTVAAGRDGEILVAWLRFPSVDGLGVYGRLFTAAGEALVEPFAIDRQGYLTELDAAVTPDGDFQVIGTGLIIGDNLGTVTALYLISPDGEVLEGDLTARAEAHTTLSDPDLAVGAGRLYSGISSDRPFSIRLAGVDGEDFVSPFFAVLSARQPALAVLPGGNLVTVYTVIEEPDPVQSSRAVSLVLDVRDPEGQVLSTRRVDAGGWEDLSAATVAVAPSGLLAVAWAEELAGGGTRVMMRGFLPDGTAAGPARELASGTAGEALPWSPRVAWTGGEWSVLWQHGITLVGGTSDSVSCAGEGIVGIQVLVPQLLAAPALALQGGRFEVRVAWRDPYNGGSGVGQPVPLTDDTGTFWFFREGNRELMVKVLDGRGVNGSWWVFYGSTTSVEFDLVVTDTATGEEAVYRNPPFQLASRGDTAAFPQSVTTGEAGTSRVASSVPFGQPLPALSLQPLDRVTGPLSPAVPPFDCADPDEPGLCLGGTYAITVRWFDPFNGGSGEGWGVPLSDDSGYFWFFDDENAELMVKVLDGDPVNGFDWVFYGSLTNVAFEMRVYDWNTGSERLYRNPPREFRSVGDTFAFPPLGGCEDQCPAGGEAVCGNDGLTYANACVAACSHRTVLHTGACTWEPPQ